MDGLSGGGGGDAAGNGLDGGRNGSDGPRIRIKSGADSYRSLAQQQSYPYKVNATI